MQNDLDPSPDHKINSAAARDTRDAPPLVPTEPQLTSEDHLSAATLRRTYDRETGQVESLAEAFDRYRELGLDPPNPFEDAYYDA